MTVTIRDGLEADVEGIARVHVQAWRETYKGFLSPDALAGLSVKERVEMWRGVFAQPNPQAKLLVAETDEGEIVGFVRGGPAPRKEADLLATETEIFAGRKLMAGVLSHLAAHGFRSGGLWVLRENLPARRFYEALGGQAGAEQTFDIRGQMVTEVAYRFEPIPR